MARREAPWRETPERVLITMGGSDTADLTPAVVRSFDGLDVEVDVVVGPGFSAVQEATAVEAASGTSANTSVVRNPDDFPRRAFNADLAVSTASSTVYELLALGTPVVCRPVADNQKLIAAKLRDLDAAGVVGCESDSDSFRRPTLKLMRRPLLRRERRDLGRELVNGEGTDRLYAEVFSRFGKHPPS